MEQKPNQPEATTGGRLCPPAGLAVGAETTGTGPDAPARGGARARRAVRIVCALFLAASGAIGLATGAPAQASTAAYSITNLGTLSGNINDTTVPFGINGSGQVVGESAIYKNGVYAYHAFLYSAGKMTDLGALPGGTEAVANAVNKYGDVAGASGTCKNCYPNEAFLYHNGKMKDLGTLGSSYPCSTGHGINDFAQVVGQACTTTEQHAFFYSGGKMTDLGTLGGPSSQANAINNSGQIVGWSDTSFTNSDTVDAVLWINGTMTDLTKYGIPTDVPATAINNSGQVVAGAYLWSNGTVTNLGALGSGDTQAQAINNLGQIVGQSALLNGSYHAFTYSGGTLQDLNNLIPAGTGVVLTEATGINNAGQIICEGYNASGYINAFLLTPN